MLVELQSGRRGIRGMPVISRFFGIMVFMNWRDHAPPHFHAKYGDDEVIVEIDTGEVTGSMNRRALSMVQEWRQLRRRELAENWMLAEQRRPLNRIPPLE
jgi:hypothetical protein